MQKSRWGWQSAGLAAVLFSSPSYAGQAPAGPPDVHAELAAVLQELAAQRREIDALRRDLAAQRGSLPAPQAADPDQLGNARGAGNPQAAQPNAQAGAGSAPLQATRSATPSATPQATAQARAPAAPPRPSVAAVGKPPERDKRPPQVAPLVEQPGVLTLRGKVIIEPGFQFGYSSSNRVALVGSSRAPGKTRSRSSPIAPGAASATTPPAPACRSNCPPARASIHCSPR